MLAICTLGDGNITLQQIARPSLLPAQVLVKVHAAAQNPTDWKTVMNYQRKNNVVGCDFSGTVVELGSAVVSSHLSLGSRVAGYVHGGIRLNGSFAEYVASPQHTLIRIPDSWSFEQACQLGVACFTACQSLYQSLSLPLPHQWPLSEPGQDILIWGGSTSVGHFAIQLAKLSGMRVHATTSPKHFESVYSLGASVVYDYKSPKAGEKIRNSTEGALIYAIDCISERTTPFQVSNSLGLNGAIIATTQPYLSRKQGINTCHCLAYTALGDAFDFPHLFLPDPNHVHFAGEFRKLIEQLLAEDKILPMPIKVFPYGLGSVHDGLEYMRGGKVSGEKIVYKISDTPGIVSSTSI